MKETISVEVKERLLFKVETLKENLLKSDVYTQEQLDAINDILHLLEDIELDE